MGEIPYDEIPMEKIGSLWGGVFDIIRNSKFDMVRVHEDGSVDLWYNGSQVPNVKVLAPKIKYGMAVGSCFGTSEVPAGAPKVMRFGADEEIERVVSNQLAFLNYLEPMKPGGDHDGKREER